eukprot:2079241-Amphidinium_carterae.1
MELNTGGNCIQVLREFDLSSFLMPVWASENDVRKIFRFSFASNTKLANVKRAVRTHFVPNASKRGIQGTAKAILSAVGTTLQVSEALCTETGFQAPKVRPCCSDIS